MTLVCGHSPVGDGLHARAAAVSWHHGRDLDVVIENQRGSTRSGVNHAGVTWSATLAADYGYIRRTVGADGDQIDCFLGDDPYADKVYVVDQLAHHGGFDEHKVLLGYRSLQEGLRAYTTSYNAGGFPGYSAVTEFSPAAFAAWLHSADLRRPCSPVAVHWVAQEELAVVDAGTSDRAPFEEGKHPRGFGGKFGHGTGTKKTAPTGNRAARIKAAATPAPAAGKVVTKEARLRLTRVAQRVFTGQPVPHKVSLTKGETGEHGEAIALAYLRSIGLKDARSTNMSTNNFPIDIIAGKYLVEVKAGLAGNGKDAQKWRSTIGEPGKAEKAALAAMTPQEKLKHNAQKRQACLDRKRKVMADYEKSLGHKFKSRMITMILNPETRSVDIHDHSDFHSRIGWNSPEAKTAYVGSFKY